MLLKVNGICLEMLPKKRKSPEPSSTVTFGTLRGKDLNLRPLGYEIGYLIGHGCSPLFRPMQK